KAQPPELKIVAVPGAPGNGAPQSSASPPPGVLGSARPAERETASGNAPSSETASGAFAFLLQGVLWGAISLLTPCVFPMIPITVSFFLKQSEKSHYNPLQLALVYSATIVI